MTYKLKKNLFTGGTCWLMEHWVSDGKFMVRRSALSAEQAAVYADPSAADAWTPKSCNARSTKISATIQKYIDQKRPTVLLRSVIEIRHQENVWVGYSGGGKYRFLQACYADLLGHTARMPKGKNRPLFSQDGDFLVMTRNPEKDEELMALAVEFFDTGGAS